MDFRHNSNEVAKLYLQEVISSIFFLCFLVYWFYSEKVLPYKVSETANNEQKLAFCDLLTSGKVSMFFSLRVLCKIHKANCSWHGLGHTFILESITMNLINQTCQLDLQNTKSSGYSMKKLKCFCQ